MEAHELLQAIQAMGEQPKITVSVEVKRSIGQWESVTGSAFVSFHLPAGTTNDDVMAEYQRLYTQAYAIAEAEAEASVQRHQAMAEAKAAIASEQAATRREAVERRLPAMPNPDRLEAVRSTLPTPPTEGRHMERAPRAEDRRPGDYWEDKPDQYILARETRQRDGVEETSYRIKFFKSNLEYQLGELFSWQESAWPDESWLDAKLDEELEWTMCADGTKRSFVGPVHIILRVSERRAERTGNYRVDVINVQ